MECALTIAGSDPSGGAGVQADLRVFHALGVHGLAVIAALTAQSTATVTDVYPVPGEQVEGQLRALLGDIRPSALKTGMLYSPEAVDAVASAVGEYRLDNLVIDPVAISTSGRRLMDEDAAEVMRKKLLPLATVVTPNAQEAGWLASMSVVSTPEEMEEAARRIRNMGPDTVIVTGGDLGETAIEVLLNDSGISRFEAPRRPGRYHGTGCAYSACITALLAGGLRPVEAARRTKELMNDALRDSFRPGRGMNIPRF
ncbi:bifunctional hydroxymethylpyrimidine kinase/phosphomethylpyrimidine kinase [Nitrospirota bacterium]